MSAIFGRIYTIVILNISLFVRIIWLFFMIMIMIMG